MTKSIKINSIILVTMSLTLHSCGTKISESTSELQAITPPSDTSRVTTCDLSDESSTTRIFRGKTISYFDSAQIAYSSEQWWKESSPWFSRDALDSSILKHPGFPANSPAATVSSPTNVRIVAVDIRKINGKLVYHYFSNETANNPLENWSSTKALVMLQAAHTLRQKYGIPMLSKVALSSSGANTTGWIADHVNEVARTSNNRTAAWFKSITGAQESEIFVRNWLVGTPDKNTAFGGAHGEAPAALGSYFLPAGNGKPIRVPQAGSFSSIGPNTLMPVLMAEFWKRLGTNRNDPTTWLKNIDMSSVAYKESERASRVFATNQNFSLTDEDLKVLLYGYVNSSSNGGLQLGATQHDEFVNAFGGKMKLDSLSKGKWRLFGKTGSGFSNSRSRNEAAFGGVFCLPADSNRKILPNGRQIAFFINAQAKGSAGTPRLDTLKGLVNAMIPELNNSTDLWK